MAELTDKELQILAKEIDKQGLTYTQLQKELLDHLCCDIEARMDDGNRIPESLRGGSPEA